MNKSKDVFLYDLVREHKNTRMQFLKDFIIALNIIRSFLWKTLLFLLQFFLVSIKGPKMSLPFCTCYAVLRPKNFQSIEINLFELWKTFPNFLKTFLCALTSAVYECHLNFMSRYWLFSCKLKSKLSSFYLFTLFKLSDDRWLNENVCCVTLTKRQVQGMQRQNTIKSRSKLPSECPLEIALTKPDDKELFYTASLHFLNKRLQEKTRHSGSKEFSQSCCSLSLKDSKPVVREFTALESEHNSERATESSLSMQQVLPFPKSSKEGFFNRMKNTFRKYRQTFSMCEANSSEELEISKSISNFKFPRCKRSGTAHSSSLVQIAEEKSDECVYNYPKTKERLSTSRNNMSQIRTRICK